MRTRFSTIVTEKREGKGRGEMRVNFEIFQGLGDFENSLCPVKKRKKNSPSFFLSFREIKMLVGNISDKFYFYSRSFG